jgi:hypothetical protein
LLRDAVIPLIILLLAKNNSDGIGVMKIGIVVGNQALVPKETEIANGECLGSAITGCFRVFAASHSEEESYNTVHCNSAVKFGDCGFV